LSNIDDRSSALTLDVLRQFRVIFGSMRQYFRLVEERCGLPASQMWALQEVCRTEGIGINDVALRMGIHQSTASLLVEKLVSAGMVSKFRLDDDQRRVRLRLESAGQKALSSLPGPAEGILPAALSALPEFALKILNINLDALICELPSGEKSFAGTPLAEMVGRPKP
jgi:MarR family transcriptional regulator, organic hydroperoxide resistance regulator